MQVADRISEQSKLRIAIVEQRAAALNLNLHELCLRAGVRYSNVWRWREGESVPRAALFAREMGKLEAVLDELEAAMLADLVKRVSPSPPPRRAQRRAV